MVQSGSSNISKVQTDDVRELAQSYSNSFEEFDGYYSSAKSIRENVSAGWTGESSQVFQEAMVAWENNLVRIMNDFNKMSNLLKQSSSQYDDHDQTVKYHSSETNSMASALSSGMGA